MRSSLALLAGLAGSALAYPTEKVASVEPRTLGLLGELLGDLTVDVTGILNGVLHHGHSRDFLHRLKPNGAAALQCAALGCKSGLIEHHDKLTLKLWLLFHSNFNHEFKKTLVSWLEGNDELVLSNDVLAALSVYIPALAEVTAEGHLYVTVDGIFDASKLESALVLNIGAQSSLSAWIEAKAGLDVDVKVGLNVCAAGGVVSSLSSDIKAALNAWINSKECDLAAHLKASVRAWINGHAGGDLVEIGSLADSALHTISVGASVGVHVAETGALSVGGQASLAAFLDADVSIGLGSEAKKALEACARGKLATAVEIDIRTKLAIWLASSECSLGVELKSVVLLWLSFGVKADVSISHGLVSGLLGDVSGVLTKDLLAGLSVDLRGALSLLAAGGDLTGLTFDARTELAAFLGGCTSIDIEVSIQIIILQWFTGCKIPGAPSGSSSSSVPSLPTSTPLSGTSSAPSGVDPTGVPTGAPGASVSVSLPSGPAPSDPASSGPATTTTPCDTETSEIVSSTVIPGPNGSGSSTVTIPVVPTATGPAETPSGAAPSGPAQTPTGAITGTPGASGPAPSGPAATSTPCDTETSEIISSTVIPGGPDGSGSSTVSIPVVPTGPAETSSDAAPSGPAETPSGPAPSGPATTPCETSVSEVISSTVIPGGPNDSGSSTVSIPVVPTGPAETSSGPAPSGPVATGPASSTPCETSVSEVVSSTVIPGVPAPSGPANTPAETPAGVEPTGVPTPSGPAPSGPTASTPCETSVSEVVSSTVVAGTPTPSAPAPTTPPMQPTGDDEEDITVTETVTSTIRNCE